MTILMTAPALRRAADMLDRLAEIEAAAGVMFDGAYNGHVMITTGSTDGATEHLKLVRLPGEVDGKIVSEPAYALEFEVP